MKKIFSIITCFFCCIALICSIKINVSANSNKYVLNIFPSDLINRSFIIENWQSSSEWFRANNTNFTAIEFELPNDSLSFNIYYININTNLRVHACTINPRFGGNFVPYYTSEYYQEIEVFNFPTENYEIWAQIYTPINSKNYYNVSISTDYEFDIFKPDFDLSLNVIYYGDFKIDYDLNGTYEYYNQMVLLESNEINSGYILVINKANARDYVVYEIEDTMSGKLIIEKLYSYNYSEFPSYIISIPYTAENWHDFFFAIIDVPLYYLTSLLSFEIFGVNVWLGVGSLVVVAFLVYLLKRFL